MAETKSPDEPALSSAKRKPDQENLSLKSQKLQKQDEITHAEEGNHSADNHDLEPRSKSEQPGIDAEEAEEEEEEEDGDDDYEDDDNDNEDDEDDHEDEEENGNTPVDRKGKGILIEEEKDSNDDDDDDDSSDGENETEGETDLSDDPLAEVDLDNILPSRTRRRVVQPGVCIGKDVGNNGEVD